jgi:hypothetical protein
VPYQCIHLIPSLLCPKCALRCLSCHAHTSAGARRWWPDKDKLLTGAEAKTATSHTTPPEGIDRHFGLIMLKIRSRSTRTLFGQKDPDACGGTRLLIPRPLSEDASVDPRAENVISNKSLLFRPPVSRLVY